MFDFLCIWYCLLSLFVSSCFSLAGVGYSHICLSKSKQHEDLSPPPPPPSLSLLSSSSSSFSSSYLGGLGREREDKISPVLLFIFDSSSSLFAFFLFFFFLLLLLFFFFFFLLLLLFLSSSCLSSLIHEICTNVPGCFSPRIPRKYLHFCLLCALSAVKCLLF